MNSHDTIDKFLSGNLSPDEMSAFLEKVESDTDLQQLLESDRIINSAIGKEKTALMNHDLSAVAGAFVAGLAATSATSSAGLITASYAKKAGFSWLTLTTSTILSVSLSAGAYWYLNSSEEKVQPQVKQFSFNSVVLDSPIELTITVPATISDKPAEIKSTPRKVLAPASIAKDILYQEKPPMIDEKPVKIRLEHSSSKYRPKNQE